MLLLEPKSPDEVIFYEFDWATRRLAVDESIIDSGWFVTGGTAEIAPSPAPSVDSGVTRAYVQGGALDETSIVTNWVETNLNPRREFSGKLKIKRK